jgi:hypothetical protein
MYLCTTLCFLKMGAGYSAHASKELFKAVDMDSDDAVAEIFENYTVPRAEAHDALRRALHKSCYKAAWYLIKNCAFSDDILCMVLRHSIENNKVQLFSNTLPLIRRSIKEHLMLLAIERENVEIINCLLNEFGTYDLRHQRYITAAIKTSNSEIVAKFASIPSTFNDIPDFEMLEALSATKNAAIRESVLPHIFSHWFCKETYILEAIKGGKCSVELLRLFIDLGLRIPDDDFIILRSAYKHGQSQLIAFILDENKDLPCDLIKYLFVVTMKGPHYEIADSLITYYLAHEAWGGRDTLLNAWDGDAFIDACRAGDYTKLKFICGRFTIPKSLFEIGIKLISQDSPELIDLLTSSCENRG